MFSRKSKILIHEILRKFNCQKRYFFPEKGTEKGTIFNCQKNIQKRLLLLLSTLLQEKGTKTKKYLFQEKSTFFKNGKCYNTNTLTI